jgi:hypothetical protein
VTSLYLRVWLVALDVPPPPSPSPGTGQAAGTHAFATYLIGGLFGLGLILLIMIVLRQRPKPGR